MMDTSNYKKAGVDIVAGNKFVSSIKDSVKSTFNKNVINNFGSFSALFDIKQFSSFKNPVLVSSTDGVGTKVKIAAMCNRYDTIGIDLVAMCVNDIITCGATPLFFLDYLATGKLDPAKMTEIVRGVSNGCKIAKSPLIGGETAEMPDVYLEDDFDMAGFSVGIVDRDNIIDGSLIDVGDVLIGLPSSGFHSNGYSLLRKIFFKDNDFDINYNFEGQQLGEMLLTPTKIYVNEIGLLLEKGIMPRAMSHITGGGFYDNIGRVIPRHVDAIIENDSWPEPDCFKLLRNTGNTSERELFHVLNMGIGFVLILSKQYLQKAVSILEVDKNNAFVIGEIKKGNGNVLIKEVDC